MGANGKDSLYSGNLTGPQISKIGTGTQTLTGNTTLSGGLVIGGGTLVHQSGILSLGGGLSTIEAGAGQEFNRRPFQPMPEKVQHLHGDPPVDGPGAWHHAHCQAVLPGRTEEREGIRRPEGRHEGAGRLVDVFTDAGPLAEGGSIVDENPHGMSRMLSREADRQVLYAHGTVRSHF